mmetsp:Transcript_19256/g.31628  ORF Transcript_19256/g.31628 Transcript_19256/m.31628 type:complete len:403 (+) Transcript_19256:203-1411(+)|eukprot:CAMPEP_0203747580 /NCGR_PEP_ID=MMETSP0098-20131031/2681_1 /ASSEMBLY_ACC=CAM_ASM_000208 /TAXON_ID=96639 /ORGANISM=" , Strain NY0313808BC1" /LENGTH=402 /DNA_ID=CAMNT_0050636035 /DNA_START=349 /DNA_END=1557 /DNA_ORIENTATION=+
MGGSGSKETTSDGGKCPVDHKKMAEESREKPGCPVDHGKRVEGCPVKHEQVEQGGCPVKRKDGQQYNVYAQPIDPTNQMPFNPNQLPAPGQNIELSTERVKSFIPKGGTDGETWTYPSPQMFFNALVRKGKGGDVDEKELATIVAVHNNMNERAWNLVLDWEKRLHPEEFGQGKGARLSRFLGRPDDISPMAFFKSTFMGYPAPFDRHDWVIDRNGKEVRYIIDFYYDEEKSVKDEKPQLHDIQSIKSISMDARPALDSVEAIFDRIRYPLMEKLDLLPSRPALGENAAHIDKTKQDSNEKTSIQVDPTEFKNLEVEDLQGFSAGIGANCKNCFEKMNTCASEDECQKASVALSVCMASLVCKNEADVYKRNPGSIQALDQMTDCLERFEKAALELRLKQQK